MKKIGMLLLNINILCAIAQNQAPVAVNDTVEAYSGLYKLINPNSNDFDPDGLYGTTSDIILDTVLGATSGTIEMFLGNHFIYTPNNDFVGIEEIKYVIQDLGNPILRDTGIIYVDVKEHGHWDEIEANEIRAAIGSNGSLFEGGRVWPHFFTSEENRSTLRLGALSIGGKGSDGTVHLTSHSRDGGPFYPGPMMDSSRYQSEINTWNRVWRVSRQEVSNHKSSWFQSQYTVPEVILNWPAHGDVSKGQAANLAPFTDINSNGIYEPMLGDFPNIKGDEAVYFIFNDDANIRPELGGKKLGVEVHGMAYGFSCSTTEGLNTTLFFDYRIVNRSSETYDEMLIGFTHGFNIGNGDDDFLGTDVSRSTYFAYNGDSLDQDSNHVVGYGNNPPAQGFTILSGILQDNDGVDNQEGVGIGESINGKGFGDGIPDNERRGLDHFMQINHAYDPVSLGTFTYPEAMYYNYLKGIWPDNVQMTYGGEGRNGGLHEAKFMFPGDTDPLNFGTNGIDPGTPYWTEETAGNTPGERRGIGSMGPFTFEPGEEQEITVAYVFADSDTGDQHSSVALMQQYIDEIKVMYEADSTPCHFRAFTTVEELKHKPLTFKLYPNPTSGTLNLEFSDGNTHQEDGYEIYDMTGRIIEAGTVQQSIDVSGLKRGLYFVRVGSLTKRFVKE